MQKYAFRIRLQHIVCSYPSAAFLFVYIPSKHTLLLHDAHWDNGQSQFQGEGVQGEGAGEHWPSWTHWLYWVWSQPWSSFSFLPFHLHKEEEGMRLRDTVIGNQIVKENQLKTNAQVG